MSVDLHTVTKLITAKVGSQREEPVLLQKQVFFSVRRLATRSQYGPAHMYGSINASTVPTAQIEPKTRCHSSVLLALTQQFCEAFSQHEDISTLLLHFSTTREVSVLEHGEHFLAPFLGTSFTGLSEVQKYFDMINSLLSYEKVEFSDFVVDTEARKVALKGRAKFTWSRTKQSWDETFAYMLDFDEEGKVAEYQVWADSGAAYLASIGQLDEIRKRA